VTASVLTLAALSRSDIERLLDHHGLSAQWVADGDPIPGSYWGEPEAGIIGTVIYIRADTPVHSLLHEACHVICAPPEKRAAIHTDASDCQLEEDATCYLQILLGDAIPGVGRDRIMQDMDTWGYTFRLGSTRAWFEQDAEDARAWLAQRGLMPTDAAPSLAPAAADH